MLGLTDSGPSGGVRNPPETDLEALDVSDKISEDAPPHLCGADPNVPRPSDGMLPLIAAAAGGNAALVRTLVKHVDVNRANDVGLTPLFIACSEGHTEVIEILLEGNASPLLCHDDGNSPLWIAAARGDAAAIRMLLDYGADAGTPLAAGSPLLAAINHGQTDAANVLAAHSDLTREQIVTYLQQR